MLVWEMQQPIGPLGKHMDYNPGTPRSEGILAAFSNVPGFHPPKKYEGAYVCYHC